MKLYNLKQSVFRIQRLFCAHFPLLKNRMNDKQAQAILESYRPCAVKLIAPQWMNLNQVWIYRF